MLYNNSSDNQPYLADSLRLETVTTSVGFDDILDETLEHNMPHVDTAIVVTNHSDIKTQAVCRKHGAICVQTDLFAKNGRRFNKGAAINQGFGHFQYFGWRLVMDADIALPSDFRRYIFNHTTLDTNAIYGADRVDVIGLDAIRKLKNKKQHIQSFGLHADHNAPVSPRYVDPLYGYIPIGFFQLFHSSSQKPYPYSLGSAAHDDVLFAAQWPSTHRRHLPTAFMYHCCPTAPHLGENWDGRKSERLE